MKTATSPPAGLRTNGIILDGDNFKKQLLNALASLDEGDFSARLPADLTGLDGKLADTFNLVAARMERFGENVSRLRNEVENIVFGEEAMGVQRLLRRAWNRAKRSPRS